MAGKHCWLGCRKGFWPVKSHAPDVHKRETFGRPGGAISGEMKKALGETQTLHAGCSKAEPKKIPTADPFPEAQYGQNLISWRRSLPSPTDPVW